MKIWSVFVFVVPLHPLSVKKSPFGVLSGSARSLRDLHGDIRSSTRGSAALARVCAWFFYGWSLGIDMKSSMTGDAVSGAL